MIRENEGLFDSRFLKLLLRMVFENTKNTILVFSENFSYFEFSVFCVLYVFHHKKKKKK